MSTSDPIGPPLDSIELVHAHGHPFLHCMPCGATFGLHWDPLTVDTIVRCAQHHVPHCPGEVDPRQPVDPDDAICDRTPECPLDLDHAGPCTRDETP